MLWPWVGHWRILVRTILLLDIYYIYTIYPNTNIHFSPGPALFVAASGHPGALYFWWPFNVLGVFMAEHARMYLETRNNNINDTPLVEDTMDGNYGAV